MNEMNQTKQMNSMNELNELNELSQTDQTNAMNSMNELNQINELNPLSPLSELNQTNQTNAMNSINELNPMNPLNELNPMNPLNELNELNPLRPPTRSYSMSESSPRLPPPSLTDLIDLPFPRSLHSPASPASSTPEIAAEPLRFACPSRLSLVELVASRPFFHSQELLSSRRSQGFEPSQVPPFHVSHTQLRSPRLSVGSPRLRASTPRLFTGPMGAATVRSDGVSFFHSVDSPPPRDADVQPTPAGMASSRRLARLRERGKAIREFGYRANEVKIGGKWKVGAVQVPNAAAEPDEQRGARDDALCR